MEFHGSPLFKLCTQASKANDIIYLSKNCIAVLEKSCLLFPKSSKNLGEKQNFGCRLFPFLCEFEYYLLEMLSFIGFHSLDIPQFSGFDPKVGDLRV